MTTLRLCLGHSVDLALRPPALRKADESGCDFSNAVVEIYEYEARYGASA
jgi:hypothetical protein